MIGENKGLLLGTVGCVVAWLCCYFFLVQHNWVVAAEKQQEAEKLQLEWKKNFANGIPKPDAEKQLNEYNDNLKKSFEELKKIEFGTPDALRPFSVGAAKTGDPKNYLDTLRKQIVIKAGDAPSVVLKADPHKDVDILEGEADKDTVDVPTSLIRLALVDRFLTVAKESGVPIVKKIQHRPLMILAKPEEARDKDDDKDKELSGKKKDAVEDPGDRLVQIPMRVVCSVPERIVGTLLYNLQKRSDATHGYFCLRGFQVLVRDTSSGTVEVSLAISALLNEKYVREELKIRLGDSGAGDEDRPANRETDPNRY